MCAAERRRAVFRSKEPKYYNDAGSKGGAHFKYEVVPHVFEHLGI